MKNFSHLAATPHAEACMETIRELLDNPKPPGNWWAKEIFAKVAAGEHVSILAYEMAKTALGAPVEREPGSDDE